MSAAGSQRYRGPLLTAPLLAQMRAALGAGLDRWTGSLDLGLGSDPVQLAPAAWRWRGHDYPWPSSLRERAIHYWDGAAFAVAQRYDHALIKLVPTPWGAPTFEIDGIKMLPTLQMSPVTDAQRKVALVAPAGRTVLDTCGGLGYFARAACEAGAMRVVSFEKNPDVLWLRSLNPWSPDPTDPALAARLQVEQRDIASHIATLPSASFDAALHDPPRFSIAGELYAQAFYDELARVLRPHALLFHYTGAPNARSRGRDLPAEVLRRLQRAGLSGRRMFDGVLARREPRVPPR